MGLAVLTALYCDVIHLFFAYLVCQHAPFTGPEFAAFREEMATAGALQEHAEEERRNVPPDLRVQAACVQATHGMVQPMLQQKGGSFGAAAVTASDQPVHVAAKHQSSTLSTAAAAAHGRGGAAAGAGGGAEVDRQG